ncbi:MAG TPA: helix-turn-helix transcriptional regulator [Streptosporangiaceae bacterium]|nr:helix-turn-helix transcriptional regulator [Streptosporangiaceae bacterium]
MEMGEVIRQRRTELGMSQADLAQAANIDPRQIRRYEASEQQPLFSVAVAIAAALRIPLSDLAGMPTHRVRLSGEWWASWQTFRDGVEKIATQQVELRQEGELIRLSTLTHGLSDDEGGYHWSGELRLWDNEILMGWYASTEAAVRDKGTMYFVLHPHGQRMSGRWVGLSNDGKIVTGWGSMAKERDAAEAVIAQLNREHGGIEIR